VETANVEETRLSSSNSLLQAVVLGEDRGMSLEHELKVAKALALQAGEMLRRFHHERLEQGRIRGSHETVTIPDLVVDDIIVSGLRQAFPHDALSSEQSPLCWDRFECDRLWLVDALDGVGSLADRGDEFTVSIGLSIRGEAVLGVVYNPMRDELYTGSSSQHLQLNGRALSGRPSNHGSTPAARISLPRSEWGPVIENIPELRALSSARSTSYDLARVAARQHDGFFSLLPLREWSTCAGVALICSAEGLVSLRGLNTVTYNSEELIHSSGMIAAGTYPQKQLIEKILAQPAVNSLSKKLARSSHFAA
jgi:myo-inositol-1(or 4)-monophosphatase